MSSKANPDLAAALADASGSSRRRPAPLRSAATSRTDKPKLGERTQPQESQPAYLSPSRAGTSPITGHFPREVRDQLKILAIERSATLHDLMAEAYNDLFAKYGKPEIAPGNKA
jgi:hypothetical protein